MLGRIWEMPQSADEDFGYQPAGSDAKPGHPIVGKD
jgi:hypothetical protein